MFTELFAIGVNPIELVVRGTLLYWFLLLVLRFVMKRNFGQVGPPDILLLVLIADAAQNAMSAEYKTVSEGLILVSTLLFWNWLLDFLAARSKLVKRLTEGPPVLLIKNGVVNYRNLRKENLDIDELTAACRKNNISSTEDVKEAYFEGDGELTVVPK